MHLSYFFAVIDCTDLFFAVIDCTDLPHTLDNLAFNNGWLKHIVPITYVANVVSTKMFHIFSLFVDYICTHIAIVLTHGANCYSSFKSLTFCNYT